MDEAEKPLQGPPALACPSERVLQSLHKGKRDVLPQALAPALEREQTYFNEGYTVAYHCIPDTRTHNALVLYETYAFVAEMAHRVRHPLVPRLIRKHFLPPWDSIDSILRVFTNDHAAEWRRIGIACSASLLSETEAPPHSMFAAGYTSSGAPKPDCCPLLEELFVEYGCSKRSKASEIARSLLESGKKVFDSVGGSMLQIFIRDSAASRYMYATNSWTAIQYTGSEMIEVLKKGNLNTMQIRLVCHPDLLLDSSKTAIFHYQFHPTLYSTSKSQFREALKEKIFQSHIGNEIRIRFDRNITWQDNVAQGKELHRDKRKRGLVLDDVGELKRRRLNVTTRSMARHAVAVATRAKTSKKKTSSRW